MLGCSNQTVAGLKQRRIDHALKRAWRGSNQTVAGLKLRLQILPHPSALGSNQTVAGLKQDRPAVLEVRDFVFKSDRCGIETSMVSTLPKS